MSKADRRSKRLRRPSSKSRNSIANPRSKQAKIVNFIDALYCVLEDLYHPSSIPSFENGLIAFVEKEVCVRDYCFSIYDPRHWGRPFPGQLEKLTGQNNRHKIYKAKARFDFNGIAEGELSIRENEIIYILANLGNGWLSARRQSPSNSLADSSSSEECNIGLVPENYVEKI